MTIEDLIKICVVMFSLAIAAFSILSLGKLAWFDPYKLEKILSERARNHPLNAYNPKYNWKAIIWMARVVSLVGILALFTLGLEIVFGISSIIK